MNKLEELVFILDKSGSMSGKEKDTIGSFNTIIKKHKKNDYDVLVSTVLFSDDQKIIHDRIDLKNVKALTEKDYQTDGCTALIDAIGNAITHIDLIQRHQRRKEDIPEHTLFVIVTDGQENASHKYSSDKVKRMIEKQKEKGWEFLFLGANIDAVETAKRYAIDESMAVNYINDSKGIQEVGNAVYCMSDKLFNLSAEKKLSSTDKLEARKNIDADYRKRKGH